MLFLEWKDLFVCKNLVEALDVESLKLKSLLKKHGQ